MKSFVQFVVGGVVMCAVAPLVHGTPFEHWMFFLPLFIGSMYATALVQHHIHWRRSRRG
jgi:hypothetical protein